MKLILNCIDEISKALDNGFLNTKIKSYQLVVKANMTLELKLLLTDEIDEEKEIYSCQPFQKYKYIVSITQFLEDDYDEDFIAMAFGQESKINFNFRRRLTELLEPENVQVAVPVVTFYSYKGGMGRTTALACFAAYMAMEHNKKVVVVDCDFEAPGLSNGNYFFIDTSQAKNGVIEYILDKEFNLHLGVERPNIKENYCYILDKGDAKTSFVVKDETGKGEMYIIPAGDLSAKNQKWYLEGLARIDLSNNLASFIENICTDFDLTEDNGLIIFDSRTGFNDTFATLAKYSKTIIGLFGINEQTKPGIEYFIQHFFEKTEQNILFVKGLAGAESEKKDLDNIIREILKDEPENLFVEAILSEKTLQVLGTAYDELALFRNFLLDITKKDRANLLPLFEEIVERTFEKKNANPSQTIVNSEVLLTNIHQETNNLDINTLKEKILDEFQVPALSAFDYEGEDIARDFYLRIAMHDIFHKNKFIIFGSKGAGKTFLYRTLEEIHDYNTPTLNRLCNVASKKRNNYIFLNVINPRTPEIVFEKKYNKNIKDFETFWILYTYYSIFNHKSIIKLIENKTYYLQNTTVVNTDFSDWLDNFINLKTFDIDREKIKLINTDLKQLDKDLQIVNKYLILSYDQLDFVIPTNYWQQGISPLVNYWRFHQFKNFFPKIFIRTDLFGKIQGTNISELKNASINIEWTREELFAYFFKILLNDKQRKEYFYQYLLLYYGAGASMNQFMATIDEELNQYGQIILDEIALRRLVEPCFGKKADFNEKDNSNYPDTYEWFANNLRDGRNQINLRSFWTLIALSISDEKKRKNNHLLKNPMSYPIISPRFYTEKGNREASAKAYFGELQQERGNKALNDFKEYLYDLEYKYYEYRDVDFHKLIGDFITNFSNNLQDVVTGQTETEQIKNVISWLLNNGIIMELPKTNGKFSYTKYVFPYFYRGLFRLQKEE